MSKDMSKDEPNKLNQGQGAGDPAGGASTKTRPVGAGPVSTDPTTDPIASKATPGAVAGDPKIPPTPTKEKIKRLDPEEEKAWREARRRGDVLQLSHAFASAILQNPKIDIFLYGSPLEAGTRGEHKNAGALLAQGAKRLTEDYLTAMEALHSPPAPAPMPETLPRGEPSGDEAGHPTNDFPLD